MTSDEIPARPGRRLLKQFAIGLPVGAAVGYGGARIGMTDGIEEWSADSVFGLMIAAMFLLTGVIVGLAGTNPTLLRRLAGPRDPSEPLDSNAMVSARVQSVVLLIGGASLMLPILGDEFDWAMGLRQAAMAAVAVLLVLSTWQSWRLYRLGDELTRSVIVSSAAVTYFIGASFIFVWAAAAKLGLIQDIGSWTVMLILTFVSLVCSVTIQLRRGAIPG